MRQEASGGGRGERGGAESGEFGMTRAVSHDAPDYPVMNLQAARHGRELHRGCEESCDARRYFFDLVPKLERAAAEVKPLRGTWNIW
ncbi:hypothetical protein [Nocardia seriolae]|uniref:hypothetical protein n=1 Tax=Nocardia seriolae TaxID=37332 RepID=UPI0018AD2522|nr:hypothetical protein [Nocardia seriolae]WKY55377.1 hypothetical protein Q5P07_15985 [Nocardia seriolae]